MTLVGLSKVYHHGLHCNGKMLLLCCVILNSDTNISRVTGCDYIDVYRYPSQFLLIWVLFWATDTLRSNHNTGCDICVTVSYNICLTLWLLISPSFMLYFLSHLVIMFKISEFVKLCPVSMIFRVYQELLFCFLIRYDIYLLGWGFIVYVCVWWWGSSVCWWF